MAGQKHFYYSISPLIYLSYALGLTYFVPVGPRRVVPKLSGQIYVALRAIFSLTTQSVCAYTATCYDFGSSMENFFLDSVSLYLNILTTLSLLQMIMLIRSNHPFVKLLASFSKFDTKFGQHVCLDRLNKTLRSVTTCLTLVNTASLSLNCLPLFQSESIEHILVPLFNVLDESVFIIIDLYVIVLMTFLKHRFQAINLMITNKIHGCSTISMWGNFRSRRNVQCISKLHDFSRVRSIKALQDICNDLCDVSENLNSTFNLIILLSVFVKFSMIIFDYFFFLQTLISGNGGSDFSFIWTLLNSAEVAWCSFSLILISWSCNRVTLEVRC